MGSHVNRKADDLPAWRQRRSRVLIRSQVQQGTRSLPPVMAALLAFATCDHAQKAPPTPPPPSSLTLWSSWWAASPCWQSRSRSSVHKLFQSHSFTSHKPLHADTQPVRIRLENPNTNWNTNTNTQTNTNINGNTTKYTRTNALVFHGIACCADSHAAKEGANAKLSGRGLGKSSSAEARRADRRPSELGSSGHS